MIGIGKSYITCNPERTFLRFVWLTLIRVAEQNADYLIFEAFLDCVGSPVMQDIRIVLNPHLAGSHGDRHLRILHQLMGAISREKKRLGQEPFFDDMGDDILHRYRFLIKSVIVLKQRGALLIMNRLALVYVAPSNTEQK